MSKKQRKNYGLRLQPYEGSLLAEVVDYLNSLDRDDANQQIGTLLVAGLLPLARYQRNESERVIRDTTVESCHRLSAQSHFLRQTVNVRIELPSESAFWPVFQQTNAASTEPVLPPAKSAAAPATNDRQNSDEVDDDRSFSPKSQFGSIDCLDNLF